MNNEQKVQNTHVSQHSSNEMLAEVNFEATGTWLEPYIGWKFIVIKTSKNFVWFKKDKDSKTDKYDRSCFDFC